MSLQTNRDSFKLEEVTLSQVVSLCTTADTRANINNNTTPNNNNNSEGDANPQQQPTFATTEDYLNYLQDHHRCPEICAARTQRIVDNRSRAPRGWDGLFQSVAEGRRQEEQARCEDGCWRLLRACPPAGALAAAEQQQRQQQQQQQVLQQQQHTTSGKWKKWFTLGLSSEKKQPQQEDATANESKSNYLKYYAGTFSLQAISRCEHAAEDFSTLLYEIANKPSKVSFQHRDPKTGNTAYDGEDSHQVNDEHAQAGGGANEMIFQNSFYGQQSGQQPQQHNNAPSEVHRKVLQGANQHGGPGAPGAPGGVSTQSLDDEIMRRWSTGRKGKLAMEEQGLIRSDEEVYKLKHGQHLDFDNKYANINKNNQPQQGQQQQQQQQQGGAAASGTSGTVPKW